MDNLRIGDLYFGITDGSAEAKNDKFQELFFDPNNKYNELMSGNEKFIVVGSKGTGKTYLANYVVAKANKNECFKIVDASTFDLCKLIAMKDVTWDDELSMALCKWFWLDRLAHLIMGKHNGIINKLPITKVGRLRRFIEYYENEEMFKTMKETTFNSFEKENGGDLQIKNAGKFSKKICGGISNKKKKGVSVTIEAERKKFFELIPVFEKKTFGTIKKDEKYIVILDDLDEIGVGNVNNGNILISLINSAKTYNLKEDNNDNFKFILLLRNDILDDLQYNNANLNKIKTSCAVDLYWLYDSMTEEFNHPLMSMILHKIRASNEKLNDFSNQKLYNELFPEKIDSKKPLDYLLDNGLGRPRDFVTFLSHAKRLFPNDSHFSAVCLKETRKPYSVDFYNEMVNQSAYCGEPKYVKQCLKLIASLKKTAFTYDEISKFFIENKNRYDLIEDLDDAIEFLYKLGAIGNVWKTKNRTVHTSWSYKQDSMNEVDFSKKFTIHYGLRKKFSL